MTSRMNIILVLIAIAAISTWILHLLNIVDEEKPAASHHQADYFMQNFSTTSLDKNGILKQKLSADYMKHYPDDDTTELTRPVLEIYDPEKLPLFIRADQGWITSDNQVILLTGEVSFWQNNHDGIRKFDIYTNNVRVLTEQQYAESDQPVVFNARNSQVTATGFRAYFKESRIELLNNVYTKILPENTANSAVSH